MTQDAALTLFKQMMPNLAAYLAVERKRRIGFAPGHINMFWLWDYSGPSGRIVASSDVSWEHLVTVAAARMAEAGPKDDGPIDDEVGGATIDDVERLQH